MYSDSAGGNLSAYEVRAYEEFPLLMPRWAYLASAFVLVLIGFFGFFLNLLVILLMFKDRQLWTPLNIILFNLVCSDFSVSVLGNPFTLASALFHRWVFGQRMCVLYGFFMALLGITSITTLTVLSFERYMMVSRPFSSRHLTRRSACFTIMFIWGYSLTVTLPPLFGWGKYVSEAANISCSVNWEEQTFNALTYILFLFATGQVVPCAVIGFSYYNIVKTMRQNAKRMGRANRAETKVTVMVFIMIIAFMVAWTPYSILALLEQFGDHGMVSPGVGVIPALIAKSSICYDPLIYVGMNTQYRTSIKRMFGIHSKESGNDERGYEQTVVSEAGVGGRFNSNGTRVKLDPSASTFQYQRNQGSGKQVSTAEGPAKKGSYDVYSAENKTSTTDSTETDRLRKGTSEIISLSFNRNKEKPDKCKTIYKIKTFESTKNEELDHINKLEIAKQPRSSSLRDKFNLEEEIEKPKKPLKTSTSLEIELLDPVLRKKSSTEIDDKNKSMSNSMVSKFFDRGKRCNSENFKTILFTPEQSDHEENCL